MGSRGFDPSLYEKPLAAQRSTGHKRVRIPEGDLGDVDRVKSVDVLARIDCFDDGAFVDVRRRWGLNKDAMDRWVSVELFDECKQFSLRGGCRQLKLFRVHPKLLAHAVLGADVRAGGGILSDQDHRESGDVALCLEHFHGCERLGLDLLGDGLAVNERHRCWAVWGGSGTETRRQRAEFRWGTVRGSGTLGVPCVTQGERPVRAPPAQAVGTAWVCLPW